MTGVLFIFLILRVGRSFVVVVVVKNPREREKQTLVWMDPKKRIGGVGGQQQG